MKNLFIGLLVLGSFSSFAGVHLKCSQAFTSQNGEQDVQEGLKSLTVLDCHRGKGYEDEDSRYAVLIKGVGIGYRGAGVSELFLTCPTVSRRRLDRTGKVSLGADPTPVFRSKT